MKRPILTWEVTPQDETLSNRAVLISSRNPSPGEYFRSIVGPSPVWIHQLWSFTRPALNGREKKYALAATFVGIGLVISGVTVGFVTLRYPINWLLSFDAGLFSS